MIPTVSTQKMMSCLWSSIQVFSIATLYIFRFIILSIFNVIYLNP